MIYNCLNYSQNQIGMYKLKIGLLKRSVTNISSTYVVSSAPNHNLARIIKPSGKLSQSVIELVIDTTTIIATVDLSTSSIQNNEKVSAILSIIHPNAQMIKRELMDNGLGK